MTNSHGMMEPEARPPSDFERELLRRSLDALESDRYRCADCLRTPLEGERVYRFDRGTIVCELCRLRHGGDPERSESVRTSEHGHAVRLLPRAA
ncbi:MAG: hypothetical protein QOI98_1131 [Solirubrobacteraceae bacterium]|nr:hypothetical protein [Solirubrobacteraceae bacterium]